MHEVDVYRFVGNRWVKGIALIPTYIVGLSVAHYFGGAGWLLVVIATLLLSDWIMRSAFNGQKIGASSAMFWKRIFALLFVQIGFYFTGFFLLSRLAD